MEDDPIPRTIGQATSRLRRVIARHRATRDPAELARLGQVIEQHRRLIHWMRTHPIVKKNLL